MSATSPIIDDTTPTYGQESKARQTIDDFLPRAETEKMSSAGHVTTDAIRDETLATILIRDFRLLLALPVDWFSVESGGGRQRSGGYT